MQKATDEATPAVNIPAQRPPEALLLIAPGCPHCPKVLETLSGLVKEGAIGILEVVNIASHPERATSLGVRSVPWYRIGPFELEGVRTPAELRKWVERAGSPDGITTYLEQQLAAGGLAQAQALLDRHPEWIGNLVPLIEKQDNPMQVRIGVGAVLENITDTDALRNLVPELGRLTKHQDQRVRSDACHYLSLTKSPEAIPYLRERLHDEDREVREIAADSLEEIRGPKA